MITASKTEKFQFPLSRVIAHRGATKLAPENTMSAFKAAYAAGAQSTELDIFKTKDGELVVMHDPSVDRTTNGHGLIGDLSAAEVSQLDAGSKFSKRFSGEKVPTLSQVLDWADGKMSLDIEIKEPGLEKELVDLLHQKKAQGRTIVSSFSQEALANVRKLDPEITTGQLIKNTPLKKFAAVGAAVATGVAVAAAAVAGAGVLGLGLAGAAGVALGAWVGRRLWQNEIIQKHAQDPAQILLPHWTVADRRLIAELHKSDHAVVPWTADRPAVVNYLLGAAQADGIITNTPEKFSHL